MFEINENFQTPPVVADYMAEMASEIKLPRFSFPGISNIRILEPTPGKGQLVQALNDKMPWNVCFPDGDFWTSPCSEEEYHCVVMNPPFNPVLEMERFVKKCMLLAPNVIALLPWSYIINSERRLAELIAYGLVSVTSLPRKTFPGCRVQVAIFELNKGYAGQTEFKQFSW